MKEEYKSRSVRPEEMGLGNVDGGRCFAHVGEEGGAEDEKSESGGESEKEEGGGGGEESGGQDAVKNRHDEVDGEQGAGPGEAEAGEQGGTDWVFPAGCLFVVQREFPEFV